MLCFHKAFKKNGGLYKGIRYKDFLGEEIVYSSSVTSQIKYLSEVSEWLSTMVDFVGGPILSGALLAQTVATLSGGKLSPFSITKPNGLYEPICHYPSDLKGFYRDYNKNHEGRIAIIDDVLSEGRTLSHSLNILKNKPVEVIVVFKIVTEYVYMLPNNIKNIYDKIYIACRD